MGLKGPTKKQFEIVFRTGIVVSSASFRVLTADGSGKIGIAASRKIGTHPARNRVKRRVREILRQVKPKLNSSTDIVVVVKASASVTPFRHLREELGESLEKAERRWAEKSGSS